MTDYDGESRARIFLVVGDREVSLGDVTPGTLCDLGLVDHLLRVRLTATRLGCSIRLTHVRPDLRELFELVGLTDGLDT